MNTVKIPVKKSITRSINKNSFSELPTFRNIVFSSDNISFQLTDNRVISIPVSWVPKLLNADKSVRENYTIRGHFVFWDSIDEIIGVKNLLNGSIVPK